MGLFDLPAPLFTFVDQSLHFLPATVRLLLWGLVTAAVSMGCYLLCSNQSRIGAAREAARSARNALSRYQGHEFSEMLPLARASLATSGRHLQAVLLPALAGSLPAVCLIVWVSGHYGYLQPQPGTPVRVSTDKPLQLQVDAVTGTVAETVTYPAGSAPVQLYAAATGLPVLELPLIAPTPVVHQKRWWNLLIANPAGYLPAAAGIDTIRLELPRHVYLPWGPDWVRGWEFSYFVSLLAFSFAIKLLFRIH